VREDAAQIHEVRIAERRDVLNTHKNLGRHSFRTRSLIHAVVFMLAFIFTAGVLALSVLLWVRPDRLFPLVIVGVGTGIVFVVSFAALRFISLAHLFPDTSAAQSGEPTHHWSKSIAYGLVALVAAVLLAGLLINVATAFTV
jgi:phosphoglycerol transferase MdoB-like AlkP superfamily enzyme